MPGGASPRLAAFVTSLLLLLPAGGCGGDDGVVLEDCPRGDGPWSDAIREARRADALEALALRAAEIAATCPERWEPLWTVAQCRYHQRRAGDSRAAFERALELARAADDPLGIASALNRLGGFARRDGDFAAAEGMYREGLEAAGRAEREDLAAFLENNLAGVLLQTGDFVGATRMLERAGAVMRGLGNESPALTADYNRGLVLLELGDARGARELLESFHRRCLERGEPDRAVRAAVTLGRLHLLTDEPELARTWLARVPDDDSQQAARARIYLGRMQLEAGRYDAAAALFDAAGRDAANKLTALFARTFRAEADLRRGAIAEARRRLEAVLAEVEATGAGSLEWLARWLLGRAALAEGRATDGIRELDAAVATLEGIGSGLGASSEALRFLRDRTGPYVDLALALAGETRGPLEATRAAVVFSVVERAHARVLRQTLGGEGGAAPGIVPLERLQRGLRPGDLLLDFLIGEDHGIVLAVRRDGMRAARLPGWSELREPLRRYRDLLRKVPADSAAPLPATPEVERFRRLLVAPLLPWLSEAGRLFVVPDGELATVPPAAWPDFDPGTDSALMPLAGVPPSWPGDRRPLLLAGDPAPDAAGDYPELPYAAREVTRIAELWQDPGQVPLLRDGFSAAAFTASGLERYRTIHLATHAIASARSPDQCALVFSGGEKLGFDEIARLPLGPSLVVLSACRTGEGEIVPGEGVLGLNWAFLRAGAQGVAVSQWRVADAATATLMVEFHERMRAGSDPVTALRLARNRLREEYRHPAYWAAFTVVLRPEIE